MKDFFSFDSILVRLKVELFYRSQLQQDGFDSILVRLKEVEDWMYLFR